MESNTPTPEPVLIDQRAVAALLSVCPRTVQNMDIAGELPRPLKLRRRRLWRAEEIRAWALAGCPCRNRWVWSGDNGD